MSDNAKWLREFAEEKLGDDELWALTDQASLRRCADEIERLTAENSAMAKVLDELITWSQDPHRSWSQGLVWRDRIIANARALRELKP